MLWTVASLFFGVVLLYGGAEGLVRGSASLARRLGLTPLVIGLTVVAFGTSTPELVVSLEAGLAGKGSLAVGTSLPELATPLVAALKDEGDIALGNVVGSNLFNILGILGTAALVAPLQPAGMSPVDLGVMFACALVLLPMMLTGRRISRREGGLLLASYALYVLYLFP